MVGGIILSDEEEVMGCLSEQHGMMFCVACHHEFGHKSCWDYRNRYHPMLIEEEYFDKFKESDSRRGQS